MHLIFYNFGQFYDFMFALDISINMEWSTVSFVLLFDFVSLLDHGQILYIFKFTSAFCNHTIRQNIF